MKRKRLVLLSALVALGACAEGKDPAPADAGGPRWRQVASLSTPRYEAAAAATGGRVYFIGGIVGDPAGTAPGLESDLVEIYDPATDRWSAGPALPAEAPRHHLAVTVLAGKIHVLSGFSGIIGGPPPGVFRPVPTSFVLDGDRWRRLADQPLARGGATAQAIDGRIYVVGGGLTERGALREALAYDPGTDAWTPRASMPTGRQHLASCALGGKLLVVGGWLSEAQQVVGAAELYDPAADTWSIVNDLPTPRGGLAAVALGDRCLALGGESWHREGPGTFPANESFTLASGQWQALAPLPAARHGLGVAVLGGAVYAVGGGPTRGNSYTAQVDVFTP
jgi:N-acetylneuraminic acid mutarotase